MNRLTLAIENCMSGFNTDGRCGVSARFIFPASFPGFQGHFPGNPVLPGVCLVQACIVLCSKAVGYKVELEAMAAAKWFAPTQPGAELDFAAGITGPDADGAIVFRCKIRHGDAKVGDLALHLRKPGSGGTGHS